ncbi:MAG TPA: PQQ-binding-like beta-propeller repeat protein [Stellaceae bacterium]|nr:PQQ-binding-like beta-propeller repeat protein [Stellaceae bacterium]
MATAQRFHLLALIAFACLWGAAHPTAAAESTSVLMHHNDAARSGLYVVPSLTWERAPGVRPDPGFAARFSGTVYAQPLYWQPPGSSPAMVLVATEDNAIYALDAESGKEVWHRTLGNPVPRSALSCGNIDPLGITGTPVIDAKRGALYADAAIKDEAGIHHKLFALSLKDGAPLAGWPIDVGDALKRDEVAFNARDQSERGALAILDDTLYVPFGGHFGDCGDYHGMVVGVALAEPHRVHSWGTRGRGGGIWAPGGISSDGRDLFVATGNTLNAREWSDGEAAFRLRADLRHSERPEDFFALKNWREADDTDADLGGTNVLPLDVPRTNGPERLLLALGKDRHAYLLDRDNLGGVGGSLVAESVATRAIRTAPTAYPVADGMNVAFQGEGAACPHRRPDNDLTALKITPGSPPRLETAWCAAFRGAGAPIVTTTDGRQNPIVWVVGAEGDNRLHAFKGDTGEPLAGERGEAMTGLHRFQTLIATKDRLYVAADGRVYAFQF